MHSPRFQPGNWPRRDQIRHWAAHCDRYVWLSTGRKGTQPLSNSSPAHAFGRPPVPLQPTSGIVETVGQIRQSFFFNETATTEIYTLSLHDAAGVSARRW